MPKVVKNVSIDDVRAANPEKIFFSVTTCWWTHDPLHLYTLASGIPVDPRGSVLMETDDAKGFLDRAEEAAQEGCYGKHGIDAFMASHHSNCIVSSEDPRPTCMTSWDDYNDMLDEADSGNEPVHAQ